MLETLSGIESCVCGADTKSWRLNCTWRWSKEFEQIRVLLNSSESNLLLHALHSRFVVWLTGCYETRWEHNTLLSRLTHTLFNVLLLCSSSFQPRTRPAIVDSRLRLKCAVQITTSTNWLHRALSQRRSSTVAATRRRKHPQNIIAVLSREDKAAEPLLHLTCTKNFMKFFLRRSTLCDRSDGWLQGRQFVWVNRLCCRKC